MTRVLAILLPFIALVAAVPYLDALSDRGRTAEEVSAQPEASAPAGPRSVVVRSDGRGHFLVETTVNARVVEMMADTGATTVALTDGDARRIGLGPSSLAFNLPVQTANGRTFAAGVSLDTVEVDGIVLRDVSALVMKPGDLETSLLGMSFLGRLGNVTMSGDTLKLVE